MGILTARPLFSLRQQALYGAIAERAMVATIRVFSVDPTRLYDAETDTWIEGSDIIHYEGKARVQPLRSGRQAPVPGNNSGNLTYLFSIPIEYKSVDLRVDQQVSVLVSPLDPMLERFEFVISEVGDSSNPIERTFYCTTNMETHTDG